MLSPDDDQLHAPLLQAPQPAATLSSMKPSGPRMSNSNNNVSSPAAAAPPPLRPLMRHGSITRPPNMQSTIKSGPAAHIGPAAALRHACSDPKPLLSALESMEESMAQLQAADHHPNHMITPTINHNPHHNQNPLTSSSSSTGGRLRLVREEAPAVPTADAVPTSCINIIDGKIKPGASSLIKRGAEHHDDHARRDQQVHELLAGHPYTNDDDYHDGAADASSMSTDHDDVIKDISTAEDHIISVHNCRLCTGTHPQCQINDYNFIQQQSNIISTGGSCSASVAAMASVQDQLINELPIKALWPAKELGYDLLNNMPRPNARHDYGLIKILLWCASLLVFALVVPALDLLYCHDSSSSSINDDTNNLNITIDYGYSRSVTAATGNGNYLIRQIVYLSESLLACICFACLLHMLRLNGLKTVLMLNEIEKEPHHIHLGYKLELRSAIYLLAAILLPFFLLELLHKVLWFKEAIVEIPMGNVVMKRLIMCTLVMIGWVYRMSMFLLMCVLFKLMCSLQIRRLQGYHKLLAEEAPPVFIMIQEHIRLRDQLLIISHRYRVFIVLSLVTITLSQFASLIAMATTLESSNASFKKMGGMLVCTGVQLIGFIICMRGAAKITHRAQKIVSIVSQWHAVATCIDDAIDANYSNCQNHLCSTYPSHNDLYTWVHHFHRPNDVGDESCSFGKRDAFVAYLQHCTTGISIYGFVLDRGNLYTIFALELSIVLWTLGKTLTLIK